MSSPISSIHFAIKRTSYTFILLPASKINGIPVSKCLIPPCLHSRIPLTAMFFNNFNYLINHKELVAPTCPGSLKGIYSLGFHHLFISHRFLSWTLVTGFFIPAHHVSRIRIRIWERSPVVGFYNLTLTGTNTIPHSTQLSVRSGFPCFAGHTTRHIPSPSLNDFKIRRVQPNKDRIWLPKRIYLTIPVNTLFLNSPLYAFQDRSVGFFRHICAKPTNRGCNTGWSRAVHICSPDDASEV